jgi:cytochrome c biogenesis protein CcmG, thiol:disulfide interchange protein DsbE
MVRPAKLAAQTLALAAVAGLLVLLVWKVVQQETGGAATDEPAPAFELPRLDGEGTVSLASLRGRAVVVNFWASWCNPCKDESPYLERLWREKRGQGLVLVGVNEEDVSKDARRFARRYALTYPVVRDKSGGLRDDYGLRGYPETFVVDRRGKIVERVAGPVHRGKFRERFERAVARALRA